jgi:hypothetical protein
LEYSARSVIQDTRRNALKTDFVITCQKRMNKKSRLIRFSHSQSQLEGLIKDCLASCSNGAETYAIMNHVLVSSISKETVFKVSSIIEAIEKLALAKNGRWQLKPS